MIKTIIPIFFTLYSLSNGNRLLLQGGAPPVIPPPPPEMQIPPSMQPGNGNPGTGTMPEPPAAVPPEPQGPGTNVVTTPGSAPGTQPSPPAQPAQPAQPVVPEPPVAPPNQLPPVPNHGTPGAPIGGGPGAVSPVGPGVTGGLPWSNPPVQPGQGPNRLECIITPPAAQSCSGQMLDAVNPDLNWELKASGLGSMYKSTVNILFTPNSWPIEELKGMWFTNEWSGAGAVINLNNNSGRQIRIAEVRCESNYSCQDMTIYTGSDCFIEQGDFHCNTPTACNNCWVKENALDAGLPCTAYVEPI